jgi:EPS-associated MarR family transcriptional regulator
MNHLYEQEIRYKLLKLLVTEANLSQREMAKRMGISLGKTNYVLTELANKGIIKIKRFKSAINKIPYTYMLTPEGLEEKAKITLKFLKRKLFEYEKIKRQIKEIASEAEKDNYIELLDADVHEAVATIR